ncbi:hypothetical protein ELS19_01435 [Halogeometricum borinquense]|uniref:Uncharacterized protein n=1 Tax=Halogeometricum borinquense TaxID=60847 RepID=A0A482TFX0_9EURY|nr:hypothetical protein [Halogeometricum borinquense]RYJ12763.1 hypothetical protein ELS19_01435 [Halogeometricum borinquense]
MTRNSPPPRVHPNFTEESKDRETTVSRSLAVTFVLTSTEQTAAKSRITERNQSGSLPAVDFGEGFAA